MCEESVLMERRAVRNSILSTAECCRERKCFKVSQATNALTSPELSPPQIDQKYLCDPRWTSETQLQALRHRGAASEDVRFFFPKLEKTSAATGPTLKRYDSAPTVILPKEVMAGALEPPPQSWPAVWGLHMEKAGTRIILEQWRIENIKQCEIPGMHQRFNNLLRSISS
jgi:hypothetical protein